MSVETIEILEPGLLTTVQDRGRYGYQRFGVPVSGAMDVFALRAANALVGNGDEAAALETTVLGPKARFLADTWIAITGADLGPMLDNGPLPRWQAVQVSRNSVLSFEGAKDGMRSYVALAGGIDVPVVMGSRSTYLKLAIGGFDGRGLAAGDMLSALAIEEDRGFVERSLPTHVGPPSYGRSHEVRVVLGPQKQAFTPDGIATFFGSTYTISMDSDRMGYRLDGPGIEHASGPDIVSDGSPLGAVQVPGDGQPIILLADRGTTGGYAKIATVISPDVDRLGQAMPGDTLTFKSITMEEAHAIYREQEDLLEAIVSFSAQPAPRQERLGILVAGEAFEVLDGSGEAIAHPDAAIDTGTGRSHRVRATVRGRTHEFQVDVRE